jgi:hypothetical protein
VRLILLESGCREERKLGVGTVNEKTHKSKMSENEDEIVGVVGPP